MGKVVKNYLRKPKLTKSFKKAFVITDHKVPDFINQAIIWFHIYQISFTITNLSDKYKIQKTNIKSWTRCSGIKQMWMSVFRIYDRKEQILLSLFNIIITSEMDPNPRATKIVTSKDQEDVNEILDELQKS